MASDVRALEAVLPPIVARNSLQGTPQGRFWWPRSRLRRDISRSSSGGSPKRFLAVLRALDDSLTGFPQSSGALSSLTLGFSCQSIPFSANFELSLFDELLAHLLANVLQVVEAVGPQLHHLRLEVRRLHWLPSLLLLFGLGLLCVAVLVSLDLLLLLVFLLGRCVTGLDGEPVIELERVLAAVVRWWAGL